MTRAVLFGSVFLALCAAPAAAADLPVKAPPIAPVATFGWSGCYIGVNGGWLGGKASYGTSPGGAYLNTAGVAAPPNAAGTGLLAGDLASARHAYDVTNSGGEIGGTVGCNQQWGSVVLGVEGDVNWSSLRNSVTTAYGPFPSANTTFTISPETEALTTRMNWFSTVRARGGYAWDRWLLYVTGGAAIGQFDSSTSIVYGTTGTSPVFSGAAHFGSNSMTRLGWTAGGGAEYALTRQWSFKAEYLYLDFGNWSYASPLTAPAAALGAGYTWQTSVREREHLVRIGINYRFGEGPIMARY